MAGEAVKMASETKTRAIESALANIEKKFGKGSIMRLGERPLRYSIQADVQGLQGRHGALRTPARRTGACHARSGTHPAPDGGGA